MKGKLADMVEKRRIKLHEFEKIIEYDFNNLELLDTALTHSSFAHGHDIECEYNERLEFLGDSILSLIISLHLFQTMKDMPEGQLTRARANIVCEQSLFLAAEKLNIGYYIAMSKGEENTGGRNRASILADAFEAIIAAIYIDGGITEATKFVQSVMKSIIESSIDNKIFNDYKSFFQEHVQKYDLGSISYKLISETGPDHFKEFHMALFLDDKIVGKGKGNSKKDAQQSAAKDAMRVMGLINE